MAHSVLIVTGIGDFALGELLMRALDEDDITVIPKFNTESALAYIRATPHTIKAKAMGMPSAMAPSNEKVNTAMVIVGALVPAQFFSEPSLTVTSITALHDL